jgi:hypothetical protein
VCVYARGSAGPITDARVNLDTDTSAFQHPDAASVASANDRSDGTIHGTGVATVSSTGAATDARTDIGTFDSSNATATESTDARSDVTSHHHDSCADATTFSSADVCAGTGSTSGLADFSAVSGSGVCTDVTSNNRSDFSAVICACSGAIMVTHLDSYTGSHYERLHERRQGRRGIRRWLWGGGGETVPCVLLAIRISEDGAKESLPDQYQYQNIIISYTVCNYSSACVSVRERVRESRGDVCRFGERQLHFPFLFSLSRTEYIREAV